MDERRQWINPEHSEFSVKQQCDLAGIARSSYYYEPTGAESTENETLMRQIDRLYLKWPFYGSPRMKLALEEHCGVYVNEKRVARLMREMGLRSILPKPNLSQPGRGHRIYPYLLKGLEIQAPGLVCCADITYIPLHQGHLYLVAVMDWFSRYVLAWKLSNTMDCAFCLDALNGALEQGAPEIFNTDQGSQFTSTDFTDRLKAGGTGTGNQ